MNKVIIAFLVFLLSVYLTYAATLTIQVEPADININTVTPSIGEHVYEVEQIVNLAALPYIQCPSIYRFDHWTGDVADSDSANTDIMVEGDKNITAVFVLTIPVCGDQCHPNFTLGDLNHDCIVDLGDFAVLATRWMNCTKPECDEIPPVPDTEPPLPNPAQWAIEPYQSNPDTVGMTAVTATDMEGNGVEYSFECLEDSQYSSGWITDSIYTVSGLAFGQSYTFRVKCRDTSPSLNETQYSTAVSVNLVMIDFNPPVPNPAEWEEPPYQNGINSIRMVAETAVDPEGNGVQYAFICIEDSSLGSGWIASSEYVTPATLFIGQTYTFRVRYRDISINQNETAPSTAVAVTLAEVDVTPPQPNPPALTVRKVVYDSQWYNILTVGEVTDSSGVEYQFVCVDVPGLMYYGVSVEWVNEDNVVNGIYPFGENMYPNAELKVPNTIWVQVPGITNHTYRVRTRDQSSAQNTSAWSAPVTTQ